MRTGGPNANVIFSVSRFNRPDEFHSYSLFSNQQRLTEQVSVLFSNTSPKHYSLNHVENVPPLPGNGNPVDQGCGLFTPPVVVTGRIPTESPPLVGEVCGNFFG
jgi:hypothetical protein